MGDKGLSADALITNFMGSVLSCFLMWRLASANGVALHRAVIDDDLDEVKRLCDDGANVNSGVCRLCSVSDNVFRLLFC